MDEFAIVIDVVSEIVEEEPPLLYDLTALQIEANRALGLSAAETLKCAQSLYEAGMLSYPRTSSHYITPDMAGSVSALLESGSGSGGSLDGGGSSANGGSSGGGSSGFGGGGSPGGGNDFGSGGTPDGGGNGSGNDDPPSAGRNEPENTASQNNEGENGTKTDANIIRDGSQLEDGKLKPNCTYQTGEYEYIYKTDSEGRISNWSTDNLKLTERDSRLPHDKNTPGKEKGDHAGHLAGDRFGGSPKIDNLVSQSSKVNLSLYKKLENQWDKAIQDGKHVKVNVDVKYDGNGSRQSKFSVTYEIDGEVFRKNILN